MVILSHKRCIKSRDTQWHQYLRYSEVSTGERGEGAFRFIWAHLVFIWLCFGEDALVHRGANSKASDIISHKILLAL